MAQYLKCRKVNVWLLLTWGSPRFFANIQFIYSACSLKFHALHSLPQEGKEIISSQIFFFLQLIECLFFLKFETFEEVIHNGIHLGQSWWQNKEAFGWQDETVKRKLLCYMRSSSNFTSDTSCAMILHKSLTLFDSQLLRLCNGIQSYLREGLWR